MTMTLTLAVLDSLPGFIHLLTVIYGFPTLPDAVDAMASEKRYNPALTEFLTEATGVREKLLM